MNQILQFLKKSKVNEFQELKEELYDKLELWMKEIKTDDMTIILDYTLCMGEFAVYSIYIPRLTSIWIPNLLKIKHYESWHIMAWNDGLKLSCVSKRTKNQTTLSHKGNGID